MKQRTARRLGWGVVALFAGLSTVALGLQILTGAGTTATGRIPVEVVG